MRQVCYIQRHSVKNIMHEWLSVRSRNEGALFQYTHLKASIPKYSLGKYPNIDPKYTDEYTRF